MCEEDSIIEFRKTYLLASKLSFKILQVRHSNVNY